MVGISLGKGMMMMMMMSILIDHDDMAYGEACEKC